MDLSPNPRVAIGDNAAPDPFGAIRVNLDDLLIEAHNYADGAVVENQAQADEASRLIDELRKGGYAADDLRALEKAPLDEQIEEIQTRYNEYIAGLKTKHSKPGKVVRAIDALKAAVKPYLDRLEAERRAEAERARLAAEEAQRIASDAARAAQAHDLAAQEAAEELVTAARQAEAAAKQIENERPQARGGDRAMGLRKTYTPVIVDRKACLTHYVVTQPETVAAFLLTLAKADVRAGKRQLPGVRVDEGTVL